MATNDILQFAGSATGTDILTQAAYAADADRSAGHQLGIARRDLENKALKQASTIAAAVAQYMADSQANNIGDTVSVATLAGYLKQAIKNVSIMFCSAGGTADALTAAFTPASTALGDCDLAVIRAASANATSVPTLAVDGLVAKTIVKGSNSALAVGDIAGAGYYLLVSYDASLDKYVLHNPATASSTSTRYTMYAQDQKPSGTDGGTFTSGAWRTRMLNTEIVNTIAGASLASNQITLPAGTYRITATAPAHNVNKHKAMIYGVSGDTGNLMLGTSENTTDGYASTGLPTTTASKIDGVITLSNASVIELRHRCENSSSGTGMGTASGFGVAEVYSSIVIEKL